MKITEQTVRRIEMYDKDKWIGGTFTLTQKSPDEHHLIIQSGRHVWSGYWAAISSLEVLSHRDLVRAMSEQQFDNDAFIENNRAQILQERKDDQISAEHAREVYDLLGSDEAIEDAPACLSEKASFESGWNDPARWDSGFIDNPDFVYVLKIFWQPFLEYLKVKKEEDIVPDVRTIIADARRVWIETKIAELEAEKQALTPVASWWRRNYLQRQINRLTSKL